MHGPVSKKSRGARGSRSTGTHARRHHTRLPLLERLDSLAWREEQVAVEPLEITIDAFALDDVLDAVDRAPMTFAGEPRIRRPAATLDDAVRVVHRACEMRRRTAGDAAADRSVVEDDDLVPDAREVIATDIPAMPAPTITASAVRLRSRQGYVSALAVAVQRDS